MNELDVIFVGIGGFFGGLLRFQLGKILGNNKSAKFPTATLLINVSGAILLGVVSGMHVERNVYLLLGDGFLGAYTTFSTFMYEGVHLIQNNQRINALTYIAGSFVLGLIGFAIGFETLRLLTSLLR